MPGKKLIRRTTTEEWLEDAELDGGLGEINDEFDDDLIEEDDDDSDDTELPGAAPAPQSGRRSRF